jgi:hypothetical protein
MTSMGWGVLREVPNREVVFGSVTQPWCANVVFQALRPMSLKFNKPDYVKIAWNVKVDSINSRETMLTTETRVTTTDRAARTKFRRYWAFFSPGIILIRRILLNQVRKEARQRASIARYERFQEPSSHLIRSSGKPCVRRSAPPRRQ